MTAPSRPIIMGMKLIICQDRGRVFPPCLLFSLCLFIATLLHCFWRIDKANYCYTAPSLCKRCSSDTYIHIYSIVLAEPATAQAESLWCNILIFSVSCDVEFSMAGTHYGAEMGLIYRMWEGFPLSDLVSWQQQGSSESNIMLLGVYMI